MVARAQPAVTPIKGSNTHTSTSASPATSTITREGLGASLGSTRGVGRLVAVQGTIIEVWPFSQGVKYLFDDGSGRIVVLLWQGVYNDVPGKEGLTAGMTIRVTGVVQEYNGQLEIIPGLGHEVSVQ